MVTKKSTILTFLAAVFGLLGLVLEFYLSVEGMELSELTGSSTEQAGAGLFFLLSLPHLVVFAVGVIVNWIGEFVNSKGCILAAAIIYGVALVLSLLNFVFVLPALVLAIIGYCKLSKAAKEAEQAAMYAAIFAFQRGTPTQDGTTPFTPPQPVPKQPKQKMKPWIIIIIVLAILGYIAIWFSDIIG